MGAREEAGQMKSYDNDNNLCNDNWVPVGDGGGDTFSSHFEWVLDAPSKAIVFKCCKIVSTIMLDGFLAHSIFLHA